jgi:hypothetical protein
MSAFHTLSHPCSSIGCSHLGDLRANTLPTYERSDSRSLFSRRTPGYYPYQSMQVWTTATFAPLMQP